MTLRSAQLQDQKSNLTHPSSGEEITLVPFCEFNAASMKNQQLTVQEMFAKHLLQLHGISVDKARAVVDKVLCSVWCIKCYSSLNISVLPFHFKFILSLFFYPLTYIYIINIVCKCKEHNCEANLQNKKRSLKLWSKEQSHMLSKLQNDNLPRVII